MKTTDLTTVILLIIGLAVVVLCCIIIIYLFYFIKQHRANPTSEKDSETNGDKRLPDIMGASKRHSTTRSDNERQEKKSTDSSAIFAAETKKDVFPPDPDSNPDLSSDSFEEIDPLGEKQVLSSEDLEDLNSMFKDAVVIEEGNVLQKDLKRLTLSLSDDMLPGEEEKAAFGDTIKRLEGTEILNNLLHTFSSTKGAILIEGLRKALRDNGKKDVLPESVDEENNKTTSHYEEINLNEYM